MNWEIIYLDLSIARCLKIQVEPRGFSAVALEFILQAQGLEEEDQAIEAIKTCEAITREVLIYLSL